MPNFYDTQAPQASGPANTDMAKQLAQLMMKGQGGQNAGGQYVPPSPVSYLNQIAGGVMQGYQGQQQAGAGRANDILNGGSGAGFQTLGQKVGGLFQGS